MKKPMVAPIVRCGLHLLLASIFLLTGFSRPSFSEELKVNVDELIRETMKNISSKNKINLVWWLPEEFWLASFARDQRLSDEQADMIIEIFRPYIMLGVVRGEIGAFGGVTYDSEEFIGENIYILDENGTRYVSYKKEALGPDIKNFRDSVKPMLTNMLGPMGQNMNFYFFPSKTEDGKKIANPKEYGNLTVKIVENEFKWRLPLSTLVPPKICPLDGEKLNGAWKYCPWHGAKL